MTWVEGFHHLSVHERGVQFPHTSVCWRVDLVATLGPVLTESAGTRCGTLFAARRDMRAANEKSPERIRTEQLQLRTFLFAKAIIDLCPKRYIDDASRTIWRQLIRAAPGASAMLDEADEASSAADFVYRMKVVLREMKESQRWLRFIADCKLQHHERLGALLDEARQLCAIFATIVRNTRRRIETQGTRTRREK